MTKPRSHEGTALHHCHANDCPKPTKPALFMCGRHWSMLPAAMQEAIWKAYRDAPIGRGRNRAYLTACAAAVEFVAEREGKNTRNSYRAILNMPNGCTS